MTNDPKLKLAMARLLPPPLKIIHIPDAEIYEYDFMWNDPDGNSPVRETEWLYVMHLVEQTLSEAQKMQYAEILHDLQAGFDGLLNYGNCYYEGDHPDLHLDKLFVLVTATFNQRALSMCKIKEIEL